MELYMTYEEFAAKYKVHCRLRDRSRIKNSHNIKYYLYDERHSGGVTGGSCWGGDTYGYSSNDPWEDPLKEILVECAPTITFLQFDALEQLYTYGDYGCSEYYGNSTHYQTRMIQLQELYNKLVEWGFLNENKAI